MNKGKRKILTNLLDVEEQTCNVPELEGSLNLKESEDPLDAFMNGVEAKLAEDTVKSFDAVQEERLDLLDDEADDNYGRVDQPVGDGSTQDDQTSEYHTGRRPPGSSGQIAPLAAVDHTTITYPSFQKEFFVVTGELNGGLSKDEVCARRKDIIVTVHGDDTLAPVNCFDQLHLPERLERAIENTGYKIPTPVQAQTIPLALAGRDVLALAETGSGKTLAYVWPALIHCASFERPRGTGPRCLVLAPTRELAAQIYREVQRFSPPMRLSCVAIYGGESKHEMALALRNKQPEIVVATPGRLIDLIKGKATTLSNVTMLIVDEADRMFAMGFGEQVRSLAAGVRPDRQALLFSATMPPRLEGLAREAMSNPVRVVVGARGASSDSVHQDFRSVA
jgi:ATP-dependent RNA helicase DDX42